MCSWERGRPALYVTYCVRMLKREIESPVGFAVIRVVMAVMGNHHFAMFAHMRVFEPPIPLAYCD